MKIKETVRKQSNYACLGKIQIEYCTHPSVAKNAIHYYVINAFDFCYVLIINLPLFNFGDYPHYRSAPLVFNAPYRGSSHQTCHIVFWHIAFDQSDVTPVTGILRLVVVQWQHVACLWRAQWQQVATSGNKWRLVAVRSHFGLRLGGRINPGRAYSNRSR